MKIKICGMKYPGNIREISLLEPDYMGFIFYEKSKRFVGEPEVINIPEHIKKVGVFVNEKVSVILEKVKKYKLDVLQLHGEETPQDCKLLRGNNCTVIKAFQIDENFCFSVLDDYESVTDYFLFDTKTENYGGSGVSFDWDLLKKYTNTTSFFISGGLGPDTIDELLQLKHPMLYGADFNSMLEVEPGLKTLGRSELIINKIRNHEYI
ncbi:N-(5'-phosphoribosyl)anthranilate isomerase [compost metagenome]